PGWVAWPDERDLSVPVHGCAGGWRGDCRPAGGNGRSAGGVVGECGGNRAELAGVAAATAGERYGVALPVRSSAMTAVPVPDRPPGPADTSTSSGRSSVPQ